MSKLVQFGDTAIHPQHVVAIREAGPHQAVVHLVSGQAVTVTVQREDDEDPGGDALDAVAALLGLDVERAPPLRRVD